MRDRNDIVAPDGVKPEQGYGKCEIACQVDGLASESQSLHINHYADSHECCQQDCSDQRQDDGKGLVGNRLEACVDGGVQLGVGHKNFLSSDEAADSIRRKSFGIKLDVFTWFCLGCAVGLMVASAVLAAVGGILQ